jgi:hypothetical protein
MNIRRVAQADIEKIAKATRETTRQEELLASRPEEISVQTLAAKIDSLRECGLFTDTPLKIALLKPLEVAG